MAASAPGLATTAGGAAGALAGWAFTSLGKKVRRTAGHLRSPHPRQLMPGDLQSQIERAPTPQANGSTPLANGSTPVVLRPAIGGGSASAVPTVSADSANNSDAGDWGGDLMDANADDDDWSASSAMGEAKLTCLTDAFEEAPVPLEEPKPSRLSTLPRTQPRAVSAGGSLRLGAVGGVKSRSQLALELGAFAACL